MGTNRTCVIVGVGPGLGASLAKRFAKESYTTALIARSEDKLSGIRQEIESQGGKALSFPADVTNDQELTDVFGRIEEQAGAAEVLIYNAGHFQMQSVLDIDAEGFKRSWEINCMGAFLCAKLALPSMLKNKKGTIILTGATASKRGGAMFARLAVGKFGLRALAESMAREFGPKGIHVAHTIIDGQIATPWLLESEPDRDKDTLLSPDAIAEQYWQLHIQDKTAWTLELDLRPSVEKF